MTRILDQVRAIPRANLTDEIVERIVDLIIDHKLKSGDKLPCERELIQTLSVGRSSLREAIRVLSATGVVRTSAGEGMFVGKGDLSRITHPLTVSLMISDQNQKEIFEARRLIEVELAVLAVDRASEQDIAEIKHRLEAMRFHQHDPVEYGRADVEFHLSVAKAAKNVFLRNVLRTLRRVLQELIAKLELLAIEDMPNAFQVHVPIQWPPGRRFLHISIG